MQNILRRLSCPTCGGGISPVDGTILKCRLCGNVYSAADGKQLTGVGPDRDPKVLDLKQPLKWKVFSYLVILLPPALFIFLLGGICGVNFFRVFTEEGSLILKSGFFVLYLVFYILACLVWMGILLKLPSKRKSA